MCDFVRNVGAVFLFWLLFCNGVIADPQPPVRFIENKNQWADDVHYMSGIPGGKMVIGPAQFKYFFFDYGKLEHLHQRSHMDQPDGSDETDLSVTGHAVFVSFQGANQKAVYHGFGKSSQYYNYYIGNDARRWASMAYAYEGSLYESVYPDIDLKIYASAENVKYDWVVAPNGDPSLIRWAYEGADKISLSNGNLVVRTSLADLTERRPFAYQFIGGRKVTVSCAFRLEGNTVSFIFPDGFNSCYELVIDPLLIFSTYSGATADNWGSTATPGEHGKLYSAGVTEESAGGKFPATPGVFQTSSGGLYDIGILKYDSLGASLMFATYLGGSNSESPHSLIMNSEEELIVLGTTSSSDFPTTSGAYSSLFKGGQSATHVVHYSAGSDIVIARLSSNGTALRASTYVGGSQNDGLNPTAGELTKNYGDQLRGDIITDDNGNIYVSSVTSSLDFLPFSSGFQPVYQGGATDGILFKMNAGLTEMLWGTYLGGSGTDAAHTLKLDSRNNILLAGGTTSADFPVTAGSYQTAYRGNVDGWIARVAADGSGLLQSTFTGTESYNQVYFLDFNSKEEIYVYDKLPEVFP